MASTETPTPVRNYVAMTSEQLQYLTNQVVLAAQTSTQEINTVGNAKDI
jgi:hypothetical protein